ncbi:transposable element Tcb1 transposase [Trichonephila clavipes]|nr:transposable element Tcb1 transposase [Trichonephila clavipes]
MDGLRTVIRNGSQRPPITSSREDRHVTRMTSMDCATTSRAPSQELRWFARQQVFARTVRRRLQQHGLSDRKPWLWLPLTMYHRQKHLQWFDQRRTWCTNVQRNPTFKQDNARSYVAGIVRNFFDTENVLMLPWSARSPDLSPIENVWSIVAERLARHHKPITTVEELWPRVEAA